MPDGPVHRRQRRPQRLHVGGGIDALLFLGALPFALRAGIQSAQQLLPHNGV
eukprot:COSAG01_NODE_690_length_14219_cov_19.783144_14_plen_52_part_00